MAASLPVVSEGPWLFGVVVNLTTVLSKDLYRFFTVVVKPQQSQLFLTLFSVLRFDTLARKAIRILAVSDLIYDSPAAALIVLLTREIRHQKNSRDPDTDMCI